MRHIAPEIFTDEFIGRLAAEHRLLWIGILACIADDQGRLIDNATLIRGPIFPYDAHLTDLMVEGGLRLLAKKDKIIRYSAGNNGSGLKLIQIRRWWKYQVSSQWAARSKFPPPPSWVDRIRTHQGTQIVLTNWEKNGGLLRDGGGKLKAPPAQVQRRPNAGPTKGQEEDDIKGDDDIKGKDDSLPPFPPSSQDDPKAAGGHGTGSRNAPSMHQLNAQQRKSAERIQKIFAVASFRDKQRAVLISVLVATRIVGGDPITSRVIPAFATAYSDSKVKDPTAVAVTRLQNDQHNSAFEDPKTWRSVPLEVLQAAGITDLAAYKIERFRNGG